MAGSSDHPPAPDQTETAKPVAASVDAAEVAGFEALAGGWWDPDGPFRPLHRFNPVRIGFIRDEACAHFGRDPLADRPLAGLRLLDIGTGGGLVAEPMARLGAEVTGIDPAPKNIATAKGHAESMGLAIAYRDCAAETLAAEGATFDIVLALEVVEHVADLGAFLGAAAALVKPGGLFIASTLNRTARAYAVAIVGAEYVLGWLPRGTHDWAKFLTPGELCAALAAAGLEAGTPRGLSFNPLTATWRVSGDTGINYAVAATPA
jgi:2-polyprenyl-6-hydroxyphenyl methylase/3-demethylubiquinone-9 3-methyltransferase